VRSVLRWGFGFALLIGLVFLWAQVVLGTGCAHFRPSSGPSPAAAGEPSPKEEARFVSPHLEFRHKGKVVWKLDAEKVTLSEKTRWGRVDKPVCTFYDREGRPILTLASPAAEVNMEGGSAFFKKSVKDKGIKGEILTVGKMAWVGATRRLEGKDGVRIEKGKTLMTARELSVSPDLKELELVGNVRVVSKSLDFSDGFP